MDVERKEGLLVESLRVESLWWVCAVERTIKVCGIHQKPLQEKGDMQNLYVYPTLMAAAVLVTGNNFDKVSLFAKCLNLNLWGRMKEKIWNLIQRQNLVMFGDGRMDSPGFSAKYCFYVMLDHYLDVTDKRETGGTSTLMEKMGCKRILVHMIAILNASEFVIDASSVIMKMVWELKGTSLNLKNLGLMHMSIN